MAGCTQKQEAFCLTYIETGNASEAYRKCYKVKPTTKADAIHVSACNLLKSPKVALRVNELQAATVKRHGITVDDLIAELEEARQAALTAETVQSSAATAATMGKAKMLGFLIDKNEHTGRDGKPIEITKIERVILKRS